jgi:hypothetical protein
MERKLPIYLGIVLLTVFFSIRLNGQYRRPAPGPVAPVKPFYYHDHDSSYYQSFERYITARFYFSQKFTTLQVQRSPDIAPFRYVPNTNLTMGVGVTYQSLSVNLGYGFGFLNTDGEKGKTRYLDIQTHVYGRKMTVDLLGQFYRSYYIAPKGMASPERDKYYIRPDLRSRVLGVSAYRLLNPDRFSFRAAMLQNEQQKKSAGSFLLGAEIYYGVIQSDSSMIPGVLQDDFVQRDVRRLGFIKAGPGAGYAYTWVPAPYFYLTGSLCVSLSADFSQQEGSGSKFNSFQFNKGFIYRVAAGYDRDNWNVNLSLVGNQMTVGGSGHNNKYVLTAGKVMLTLAHRIRPGRAVSKKLRPVDKAVEDVKGLKPPKQ